jgi:hypothetical protein
MPEIFAAEISIAVHDMRFNRSQQGFSPHQKKCPTASD